MKNKNYLITVTNEDIRKMKVKNINFLFPIKNLCVGYFVYYDIAQIKEENSYILVNRILDKKGLEQLSQVLKSIPKNIKGICFTDLGVIDLVKELNLTLQLIYMQNHNTTNDLSINYYLESVDSVLISTDITKEEILNVLNKASKPLVLPFFMLVDVMYSRRLLLSNFAKNFNLQVNQKLVLHEPISMKEFLGIENKYGTILYYNKYLDYREINHNNVLFYYINPINLDVKDIMKVINGENINNSYSGFLNIKTHYQLKEDLE